MYAESVRARLLVREAKINVRLTKTRQNLVQYTKIKYYYFRGAMLIIINNYNSMGKKMCQKISTNGKSISWRTLIEIEVIFCWLLNVLKNE